ncbi:arylamine N-acetyltransferase [Streptomyces sp. NPDC097619]|uniref:arylamine N-acetyltransferase family protein n=1 Tax=Streptomyces sp. NPDC097619 TaxID=3157228 RepID=UPI003320107B
MWQGDRLDLDAYLRRTGCTGELRPDLATLTRIVRAHTEAIPFESLDVLLGHPVALDVKSLEDKLVRGRRGGYCYEQNSLLAAVLERIGFEVAGRGARNRTRGDLLLPVTHALLVVTLDGAEWLCDAGFGHQSPREPVPLARPGTEHRQGEWRYLVREGAEGERTLCLRRGDTWRELYSFSPQRHHPVDYVLMNHYSSSHPRSAFLGRVIAQRSADGPRTALVGNEFSRVHPDGREEKRTVPAGELIGLLDREFGIRLSETDAAQLLRTY